MTSKLIRPGIAPAMAAGEVARPAPTADDPLPSRIGPRVVDLTGLPYDRSDIEETTTTRAGAGWALTGRGQPAGDPELEPVQLGYIPPPAGGSDEPQGLPDDPRTWWFTFPAGHVFVGRYAVAFGTYDVARAEVIASFGETFVGQFASAEEAGVKEAGLLRLRRDQWPSAVDEQVGPADQPAGDAQTQVMPAVIEPAAEDLGECSPCTTPRKCAAIGSCQLTPADDEHTEPAASDPLPAEVEHRMVRGWKGGPGECGAECACGLTYDGFDTLGGASELLDRHIANPDPVYRVVLPETFAWADRVLTIPAPHTAGEIATVIHAELVSVGYDGASIDVDVLLPTGTVRITWNGAALVGTITGPGVGDEPTDRTEPGPEPRRVPAGELQMGMYVATDDPDWPGQEVRHVEPADDGSDFVGVVFAGPSYAEYTASQPVELVDRELVDQARGRARARARRAQQIEALRGLALLAERDEFFPLPRFTLRMQGGLDSLEAVRRFAAAVDVPVSEDDYGARAVWCYGGDENNPAVVVEANAPHKSTSGAGR